MRKIALYTLFLIVTVGAVRAQNFSQNIFLNTHLAFDNSSKFKLCALPGGDFVSVLIRDSNYVLLTRFNTAGTIVWSKQHKLNYVFGRAFFVNYTAGEIVLTGTLQSGGLDILFLLRFDAADGSFYRFKYFIPSADKFGHIYGAHCDSLGNTYAYLLTNGLLPGGTAEGSKGRVILKIDRFDNVLWCNKLEEYSTFWGESTLASNGDLIITSHNMISRFSANGTLIWSKKIPDADFALAPVEYQNELYVCNFDYNAESYVYKLSSSGEVLNVSKVFKSTNVSKIVRYGNVLVLIGSRIKIKMYLQS